VDHIGAAGGFGKFEHLETILLGVIPIGEAVAWPGPDDHFQAAVAHAQRLRPALDAVPQHGNRLSLQYV